MQSPDSEFCIRTVDQDGNLDFRGRDRLDVDAFFGKCTESGRGNARMAAHADADDRDLDQPRFALHDVEADLLLGRLASTLIAFSTSPEGTVKVMSVFEPSSEMFWTIMSTLIWDSASGPKIAAETPGRSATRRSEI